MIFFPHLCGRKTKRWRIDTTFIFIGFEARSKIDSETHKNATFDRHPMSNAVQNNGNKGSEKDLVDGLE